MEPQAEVIDGEIVDPDTGEIVGNDIERREPQHGTSLFATADPDQALEDAGKVANALKKMITAQGLVSKIQGRDHVNVEGWQALGAIIPGGVFAVEDWTHEVAPPDGVEPSPKGPWGYESRYVAMRDGVVIGAGRARCTRSEKTWSSRDDYALESMAQTRATAKALKGPLGWLITLAGYQTTPGEEMPREPVLEASDNLKAETKAALIALAGDDKAGALYKVCTETDQGTLTVPVGRTLVFAARAVAAKEAAAGAEAAPEREQAPEGSPAPSGATKAPPAPAQRPDGTGEPTKDQLDKLVDLLRGHGVPATEATGVRQWARTHLHSGEFGEDAIQVVLSELRRKDGNAKALKLCERATKKEGVQ